MTKYLDKEKTMEYLYEMNVPNIRFINGEFDIEPDKDKHTKKCFIKNAFMGRGEYGGLEIMTTTYYKCICKEGVPRETK